MKKSMCCIIIILFFPLFTFLSYAQSINEVFPNPDGDDNNKEFVEIYSNGFVNLSGFIIGDSASNDTLVGLYYESTSNYSLIVEEGYEYGELNASIYSVGATIGNNLGNSEDTVSLYTSLGLLLDTMAYTSVEEDKSIEKNETGFYTSKITGGTPGTVNSVDSGYIFEENSEEEIVLSNVITLENALPETVYTNQEVTKGFRIENNHDEEIDVTLFYTLSFNESIILSDSPSFEGINSYKTADTVSFIIEEAGNYTLCGNATTTLPEENLSDNVLCTSFPVIDASGISCDRNLSIYLNQTFYPNEESVPFDLIIDGNDTADDFPFIISYSITEFLGEEVKSEKKTSTTSTKHWTPEIENLYGVYIVSAQILETTCNDTNSSNNVATAFFIVENTAQQEQSLAIDHIYTGNDGVIETGEIFRIKIEGFTGNITDLSSSEKTIQVYVEDQDHQKASETSKITIEDSFTAFTTTIPIMMDYSCTSYPNDETYTVIAESSYSRTKEEITVAGIASGLCTDASEGTSQNVEFTTIAYTNSSITTNITLVNTESTAETYTVSSVLSKGSIIYDGAAFANAETMVVDSGDEEKISLKNDIPSLETGIYEIIITIENNNQNTKEEVSNEIYIIGTTETLDQNHSEEVSIVFLLPVGTVVDNTISLFSQIDGNGTYTFILESSLERSNQTTTVEGTATLFFHPSLVRGKNLFVLSIFKDEQFITAHPLLLYANSETIETVSPLSAPDEQKSSLEKVTGYTVLEPIPATSFSVDIARVLGIFFFIILCLCLLLFHKKLKAKIYKTTDVSADNATDQSKSDY